MSTWRMTFTVLVDDDGLAEHDGDHQPPPNDPEEWIAADLIEAIEMGVARVDDEPDSYKVGE